MSPKTVGTIKWTGSLVSAICLALAAGNVYPPATALFAALAAGLAAWLHAPVPETADDKLAKAVAEIANVRPAAVAVVTSALEPAAVVVVDPDVSK